MVCGNLPFLTQDQILAKQLTWRSRHLSPQLKVSAVTPPSSSRSVIFPQLKVSDLSHSSRSVIFPQLKVSDLPPAQGQ
jgi:hypothetical protein